MSRLERAIVLLVREAHRIKFWQTTKTLIVYTDNTITEVGSGDSPSEAVIDLAKKLQGTIQIGLGRTIESIMTEPEP